MINESIVGYKSAWDNEVFFGLGGGIPEEYLKATYSLSTKYLYNANEKWKEKDYQGAIEGYTKALKNGFNPLSTYLKYNSYLWRGKSKYQIKDYNGAIEDLTKTLEIEYTDLKPYLVSEALSYGIFGNYTNRSISSQAYLFRALSRFRLNDKTGACQDFLKAQSLGYSNEDMTYFINLSCN